VGAYAFFYFSSDNAHQTQDIDNTSGVKEDQANTNPPDSNSNLPTKTDGSSDNYRPDPNTPTPTGAPEKPNLIRADTKVLATFQQASIGYCELSLSKDSLNIVSRAEIVVGPSYYSCSFTTSDVEPGQWTAIVTHKIGNASTASDSRILEVSS
jgi:hypothetical protein